MKRTVQTGISIMKEAGGCRLRLSQVISMLLNYQETLNSLTGPLIAGNISRIILLIIRTGDGSVLFLTLEVKVPAIKPVSGYVPIIIAVCVWKS